MCLPQRQDTQWDPTACLPQRQDTQWDPAASLPQRQDTQLDPAVCLPQRQDTQQDPAASLPQRQDTQRDPAACLPQRQDTLRVPFPPLSFLPSFLPSSVGDKQLRRTQCCDTNLLPQRSPTRSPLSPAQHGHALSCGSDPTKSSNTLRRVAVAAKIRGTDGERIHCAFGHKFTWCCGHSFVSQGKRSGWEAECCQASFNFVKTNTLFLHTNTHTQTERERDNYCTQKYGLAKKPTPSSSTDLVWLTEQNCFLFSISLSFIFAKHDNLNRQIILSDSHEISAPNLTQIKTKIDIQKHSERGSMLEKHARERAREAFSRLQ